MNLFRLKNKPEVRSFALPVASGWELWSQKDRQVSLVRKNETLEELLNDPVYLIALPVEQVFALPLWINVADETLIPSLIQLQLERRGLLPRAHNEVVMDYQIVLKESHQMLILVTVLPEHLPDALQISEIKHYEVSARFWPLPPNEIIIWKEDLRVVMALTRENQLCYFQSLGQVEINPALIEQARSVLLQLKAQNVISTFKGITAWGKFSREEIQLLQTKLQLTVKNLALPHPQMPDTGGKLVPHSVQNLHGESKKEQKRRHFVYVAAILYFVVAIGWSGLLGWEYLQKYRLESEMKKDAPLVSELSRTAEQWRDLQPAINPKYYPLEFLYQCVQALPPDGVYLTLFEYRGNKILIRGEAKNARTAFKFKEDLGANPASPCDQWQMPQPNPLPNDSTQFQIEGEISHAPIF